MVEKSLDPSAYLTQGYATVKEKDKTVAVE